MAYIGKSPSQAVRNRYFFTASGGETSISSSQISGFSFSDGAYTDVYLNGVLLVAGTDYNTNTANTIAGLSALVASDIVEIVVYDTFSVFGGTFQGTLTASEFVGPLTGNVTGELDGSVNFTAKNVQGSTILKGTPVYIAGHSGNDPEIGIADANDAAKMPAFGIATTDIANNNKGNVIVFGNYIGIDTSTFTVGDELYVSNTGTLTTTRPSGSADQVQKIAKVIRSQSQNGQIFVMGAGRSNDTPNAITANSINLGSSTTVSSVLDEDAMTSNSATSLATQQSIKAYVDTQVATVPVGDITEVTAGTGLTGGGASGAVTLNVVGGTGITANADDIAIDATVATLAGTQTLTNKTLGATSVTADISFGDNDKAIFGAGSDLQIHHNGSNSVIEDVGTGNLKIKSNGSGINFQKGDAELLATMATDGAVTLYHDNAAKIATTSTGVSVTGTSLAHTVEVGNGSAGGTSEVVFSDNVSGRAKVLYDHGASPNEEMGFEIAGTRYMTIENGGNVGIGTASPTLDGSLAGLSVNGSGTVLHVNDGNGATLKLTDPATGANRGLGITLQGTSAAISNCESGELRFGTGNTERGRFDASGNLLVGTTNANPAENNVAGIGLLAGNTISVTDDGGAPIQLNRKTSDGSIAIFRKDGTTVGSIGTLSGRMYAGTGDVGVFFDSSNNMITPYSLDAGDTVDNTIDLGYSSRRFKNLYLSGGAYIGGTGSANALDDYEEGNFTATIYSGISVSSYDHQLGHYVKIGRQVTAWVFMEYNGSSRTSDILKIAGLPFTSSNSTSNEATFGGFITYQNGFSNAHNIVHVGRGDTKIEFYEIDGSQLIGSELSGASGEVRVVVQYTVA